MGKDDELVLINVLREAIRGSGLSLAEIERQTKVSSSQLSRFLNGKTLTLVSAAKLFKFFRMRIVIDLPPDEPLPSAPPPATRRTSKGK